MSKKLVAITLVICMVLSVMPVFAAEFTDVLETVGYYDAVKTLSEKNVIKGYPDGTFKPENDVIRAEFTTMLVRAMGDEAKAFEMGADGLPFNDCVDPDIDYAVPHINLAYSNGIVIGVGEDRFEPSRNVTYEEAVKMIVCGLGLEEEALKKGAYPDGYLTLADEKGLLEGVSGTKGVPAKRWQIAQALYNGYFKPEEIPEDTKTTTITGAPTAVTADSVTIAGKVYPLSEAYKLSRTNKTEIKKGVSMVFTINSEGEILSAIVKPSSGGGGGGGGSSSSSKPTAKIQGIVLEAEDGTITIKVTKGDSKLSQYVVGNEYVIDAGSVNTANMLGRVIDLTFTDLNSDPTLKSAVLTPGRQSLTVNLYDIHSVEISHDIIRVNYYTDRANNIRQSAFVPYTPIYTNGQKSDLTLEDISVSLKYYGFQGTIEFYAAENMVSSTDYDTVFLRTYEYLVAHSYNSTTNEIQPHIMSQYSESIDCTNLVLVDESGKTVLPATLKKMDILAVEYFSIDDMEIDIVRCVLLKNRTVTGTVTELDYYSYIVVVDGIDYWLDYDRYRSKSFIMQDQVILYLGYGNQVVCHVTQGNQDQYGILVSADEGNGLSLPTIKMITDKGFIVTASLDNRVRVIGSNGHIFLSDSWVVANELMGEDMIGRTFKYKMNSNGYISTLFLSMDSERPANTTDVVPYNKDAYLAGRIVTNIENALSGEISSENNSLQVNDNTYSIVQDTKILYLNRQDKSLSQLTFMDIGIYNSSAITADWDISGASVSVIDSNMYEEPALIIIDGEIKNAVLPVKKESLASIIKYKEKYDETIYLSLSSRSGGDYKVTLPEVQYESLRGASLVVPNNIQPDGSCESATVLAVVDELIPKPTQELKDMKKTTHWFGNVTDYQDGKLTISDQLSGKSVTKAVPVAEVGVFCNITIGGTIVSVNNMSNVNFDSAAKKPVNSNIKNYCVYVAETDGVISDLVVYSVPHPVSTEIKYGVIDFIDDGYDSNSTRIRMMDSDGSIKVYYLAPLVQVMTYDDGEYNAALINGSNIRSNLSDLPAVCKYRMNASGQLDMIYTCQPGDFPLEWNDAIPFSNQAYDMGRLVNNKNYDIVEINNSNGDIKITDGETEYMIAKDAIVINVFLDNDGLAQESNINIMNASDLLYDQCIYAKKISLYDADSQGRVKFVYIVNGEFGYPPDNQKILLIRSLRVGQNEKGEEVEKLNVYETFESSLSTYTLTPDCIYKTLLNVGSAVMPRTYNANKEVNELLVFTDVDFDDDTVNYTYDLRSAAHDVDSDTEYAYGKIVKKSGSTIFIENELNDGEQVSFIVSNSFDVLECDLRLPPESAVKIRSISDVSLVKNTESGEPEDNTVSEYKVLIRRYRGEIRDVVLYILPAQSDW